MSFPVRCFTCGKVVGHFEETYAELLAAGVTRKEALDKLGLVRDCCRGVVMTSVDHLANIMPHAIPFYNSDESEDEKTEKVKKVKKTEKVKKAEKVKKTKKTE